MSDQKISAMPDALTLTGAEFVPLVQDAINVKSTLSDMVAYDRAYGSWSDTTDQTGSITDGTVITFDTTDITDSITLVDNSKMTVPEDGIYSLQFSIQFKNTDNGQHDATVWLRVDGVDLGGSGTQVTIPARKSAGVFGYNVMTVPFMLDLNKDQYVEIVWLPSSTLVTIEAIPASASPAYPAVPSIIASMFRIA